MTVRTRRWQEHGDNENKIKIRTGKQWCILSTPTPFVCSVMPLSGLLYKHHTMSYFVAGSIPEIGKDLYNVHCFDSASRFGGRNSFVFICSPSRSRFVNKFDAMPVTVSGADLELESRSYEQPWNPPEHLEVRSNSSDRSQYHICQS